MPAAVGDPWTLQLQWEVQIRTNPNNRSLSGTGYSLLRINDLQWSAMALVGGTEIDYWGSDNAGLFFYSQSPPPFDGGAQIAGFFGGPSPWIYTSDYLPSTYAEWDFRKAEAGMEVRSQGVPSTWMIGGSAESITLEIIPEPRCGLSLLAGSLILAQRRQRQQNREDTKRSRV
ncbi:MAG: hypothetical protein ACR2OZ_21255 [Verrucomicrobiales bacterium]